MAYAQISIIIMIEQRGQGTKRGRTVRRRSMCVYMRKREINTDLECVSATRGCEKQARVVWDRAYDPVTVRRVGVPSRQSCECRVVAHSTN